MKLKKKHLIINNKYSVKKIYQNNSKYKIAICFLTYGNLSKPELWKKFINSRYNIYIHNKYLFSGIFNKFFINKKVKTRWGDLSLVQATLLLFKEAFKNKENKYFILLSDKCIPLYSPNNIYKFIFETNSNIFHSRKAKSREHVSRFNTIHNKELFNIKDFNIQSQWMILKRNTISFFLDNNFLKIFGTKSRIPDEMFFVNIMNKYNIPFINRAITYVNWKEISDNNKKYRNYPKTYSILTNDMIENILKEKTLFMRKISPECKLPSYFDNL